MSIVFNLQLGDKQSIKYLKLNSFTFQKEMGLTTLTVTRLWNLLDTPFQKATLRTLALVLELIAIFFSAWGCQTIILYNANWCEIKCIFVLMDCVFIFHILPFSSKNESQGFLFGLVWFFFFISISSQGWWCRSHWGLKSLSCTESSYWSFSKIGDIWKKKWRYLRLIFRISVTDLEYCKSNRFK